MMQSETDSPCNRTFCSRCHVFESIGIRQLPFGKRGKICSKGNSGRNEGAALLCNFDVRHWLSEGSRGRCWPRAAIA